MWRHIVFSAVILALGASFANADLFLTIDGENPTGIPLMLGGTGPYHIVLDGNTPIGPNDIRFELITGILTAIPDTNNQYALEYEGQATMSLVRLIANVDLIIDGFLAPAGMTIYELFVFCNPEFEFTGACGTGLADFIPPPEEEGEGEETIVEEPDESGESNPPVSEESSNETEIQIPYDYNSLVSHLIRQEKQKILQNCPSIDEEIIPYNNREEKSITQIDESGEELTLDGVIEINSDITMNQIWTANNTYHVTAGINVQALLVIEPGTIIEFSSSGAIHINNGGTLISCGTPDNLIVYTSDSATPAYGDYYCPIYVEETASASTKITYSYIEYAYIGINVVNNRLDCPIENNYLYSNVFGIVEYGTDHTNIINNLLYATYSYAIDVNMASITNEGDADSYILIQNNTCDYYQDIGIIVRGVIYQEDAGSVVLSNNIVSGSYQYGLALVNGYMFFTVTNNGYYDNEEDRYGYDVYYEKNPVYETEMPYIEGTHYLRQDCNFINAGYELIEETTIIGKTTDVNNFPDSNYTDIGFHYPNWDFSNAGDGNSLTIDLNGDLKINFMDFAVLANGWQQMTYDINDLNTLADEWLKTGSEPNIEIQIFGDSNDGFVEIGITGFTSNTLRVFLLLDGQFMGEMPFFQDGKKFNLDISALGGGQHELKAISTDIEGKIVCSNITQTSFPCSFNYCSLFGSYEQNEPYLFSAYYPGSGNINVKVYDEDDILVWSQTYSSQNLNSFIPSNITSRIDLDSIVFEPPSGSGTSIAKPLALKFNPEKIPANIRALIVLPDLYEATLNGNVTNAVKQAYEAQGVPYYELENREATYSNLAWFGANRNIDYIYYSAHGTYNIRGVLRTTIWLYDGIAVSIKQSDCAPGTAPPWCTLLPGSYEKTANSFLKIGFMPGRLKFVHFDCCNTGRLRLTSDNRLVEGDPGQQGLLQVPDTDMSVSIGMVGEYDQFYQGWWGNVEKGYTTPINAFSVHEWTKLKEGENLYEALQYAIDRMAFEPLGYIALDNFRVFGRGLITAIRID